jgi:hypothetical protein
MKLVERVKNASSSDTTPHYGDPTTCPNYYDRCNCLEVESHRLARIVEVYREHVIQCEHGREAHDKARAIAEET